MKQLWLGLLLCLTFNVARAEEGAWLTDLPKAQEVAAKEKKLILMDFTGSDWCPPCKLLHRNVLTKPEFKEFAKDHLVLVELDFPRSKPQSAKLKKANQDLAQRFKIEGYPTVIVLDAKGKEVWREVGYSGANVVDYVAQLRKLKAK